MAALAPARSSGTATRRRPWTASPGRQFGAAVSAGVRLICHQRAPPGSPPGTVRAPTMDRVKTTKGACYTIVAALMLASAPLILALPAIGAPCDPVGGIVPVLICPTPPDRPDPTATPVPTASATGAPVSPSLPPGSAPAPRASGVPAQTGTLAGAPTAGPASQQPAGVAPTTASPADGSTATPVPTATAPSAPDPSATAGSLAPASPAPGDLDGRSVAGALLLALGGLLVIAWVFLDIRTSA